MGASFTASLASLAKATLGNDAIIIVDGKQLDGGALPDDVQAMMAAVELHGPKNNIDFKITEPPLKDLHDPLFFQSKPGRGKKSHNKKRW